MLEVQTKLKRQIELLGLAIGNAGKLKDFDFAEILGRDIPTIKRDMQAIRSMGIQIHSLHGKGVAVEGEIPLDQLQELVLFYLWISNAAGGLNCVMPSAPDPRPAHWAWKARSVLDRSCETTR